MKISTQYLVSLLSCIKDMPGESFQPDSLAARWKASGKQLDERFILHYEVLFDYAFLVSKGPPRTVVDWVSLMNAPQSLEPPHVNLSSSGRDFLARYGD